MKAAGCRGRKRDFRKSRLCSLTHLVVYPLVDPLLVVQHDKRLGGDGVSIENETEVTALALHVGEVRQGCVQSVNTGSVTVSDIAENT